MEVFGILCLIVLIRMNRFVRSQSEHIVRCKSTLNLGYEGDCGDNGTTLPPEKDSKYNISSLEMGTEKDLTSDVDVGLIVGVGVPVLFFVCGVILIALLIKKKYHTDYRKKPQSEDEDMINDIHVL